MYNIFFLTNCRSVHPCRLFITRRLLNTSTMNWIICNIILAYDCFFDLENNTIMIHFKIIWELNLKNSTDKSADYSFSPGHYLRLGCYLRPDFYSSLVSSWEYILIFQPANKAVLKLSTKIEINKFLLSVVSMTPVVLYPNIQYTTE